MHDLPGTLDAYNADLFALSVTLSTHIDQALEAIQRVREHTERSVKIMIGGAAFDEVPELAKQRGADAYMRTLEEAITFGRRMETVA